jgi:glyoxylase-like metal-dependent hydrolase (beta-lactamase superfamily II)
MLGEELRSGLRRWTAYHPEWKEDVGCVALDAPDALVLVDPLLPAGSEDELAAALPRPPEILVTVYWHTRSARALLERLPGARVWAVSGGAAAIRRRAGAVEVYRSGAELPGGVRALGTARRSEVVFWLPEHRALVAGDVLLGDGQGGVRLCPASWLPSGVPLGALAESLRPLLDLPVELVLVSHGEPVLERGRDALKAALDELG